MHFRLGLLVLALVVTSQAAPRFDAAPATNAVGLSLFRSLAERQPEANLVISPYSIESALTLAYAGADGATRAEMARALQLPTDDSLAASGFSTLRAALDEAATKSRERAKQIRRGDGNTDVIEWRVANRLFGQRGYAFREDFLARLRDDFGAPLEALDFRTAAEPARLTINGWVEEQTRNRIKELIPPRGVNETTRLVLVNALYLKAPWANKFETRITQGEPFNLPDGSSVAVPTMRQRSYFRYADERDASVVALDYMGGDLQFLIILPRAYQTPESVAARLTPDQFADWSRPRPNEKYTYIDLHLPKFRVEGTTLQLGDALSSLGLKSAFDRPSGTANFERIAPRRPRDYFALSDVFHKTFVAVDEEGTEAAAASAVSMISMGVAPKRIEVRVDRPFLFAIQHRASGACLFIGRISDPR